MITKYKIIPLTIRAAFIRTNKIDSVKFDSNPIHVRFMQQFFESKRIFLKKLKPNFDPLNMQGIRIYLIILVILSMSVSMLNAQNCPTANVELGSQAEIDSFVVTFGDCTIIEHDLAIRETAGNIKDLSGLRLIGSQFNIINNNSLVNFNGLKSITANFINFNVRDNDNLTSLGGLEEFSFNRTELRIENNSSISDITALSQWPFSLINGIAINGNAQLSEWSIESICKNINENFKYKFANNLEGCNTNEEVINACNNLTTAMREERMQEVLI